MSMPIQRQSEAFGIFDDGPRFARDRSSTDLPRGLAGLINTMGPRIQAGLLNTRTAVNVDGMDPESHAYHTELPWGAGGDWIGDEDGHRTPKRQWNPDFGYEMTDEDERRAEGVAEDDDSGYNWGPDPSDHLHPDDIPHSPTAEPFDTPIYNPRSSYYDDRTGSRHPFDRTAAPMAAPPMPQMAIAGGYQIGHRVGLPWRDRVIPGTVVGGDPNSVQVIWDDQQKSSEEPHNIQLL